MFYMLMQKGLYRMDRLEYEQSEREMKNYLKYSILITLTLLITIGFAQAVPIGITMQVNPFESLPSATVKTTPPTASSAALMFDGDTDTSGYIYCSGSTGTTATFAFYGFSVGAAPDPIGWVSIQLKYTQALMTDDTWKWQYTTDNVVWTDLTVATTAKFDSDGTAQFQSFSQLAEPTDGTWTWDDIGTLRVRVLLTKGGTTWDGSTLKVFRIYEVWASIYAPPTPPVSTPTMSLQSPSISPQDAPDTLIFVEIYCNDVTALAGWQYQLNYDPTVLTYAADWNYYPWTDAVPDIGADYVGNAGTIPTTNPLYLTGMTGNFAVARIYFTVNSDGADPPMPVAPNFSWLRLSISFMGDPEANKIPHHVYNGYYGTPPETSYMIGSEPIPVPNVYPYEHPISSNWIEEFPNFGNRWHLASFIDNGDMGLNPSDQIDMVQIDPPVPGNPDFHVDQIWECNADPQTFVFMILTIKTIPEFPFGIGIVLIIAPATALIYVWRTRRKVTK
jgi:hypothetical protein